MTNCNFCNEEGLCYSCMQIKGSKYFIGKPRFFSPERLKLLLDCASVGTLNATLLHYLNFNFFYSSCFVLSSSWILTQIVRKGE
jgi:hypothetical protein